MTIVNIDRRKESQKTIVNIEFTTLGLCKVQNFIEIERFVVFGPKLWPKRWQVPIPTGAKIAKNYCHYWIHWPRFMQSTKFHQNWSLCRSSFKTMTWKMAGANIDRCQHHINEFGTFKLFTMQNFVENG